MRSTWPDGRPIYYALDENHVARPANPEQWYAWIEHDFASKMSGDHPDTPARVAWHEWLEDGEMLVQVSTVFIGIDTSLVGQPDRLFETMVFGGEQGGEAWKWATWDEAVAGHATIVAEIVREVGRDADNVSGAGAANPTAPPEPASPPTPTRTVRKRRKEQQ